MKLSEIAELVGGEVRGDASLTVTGVAPIHTAEAGDISFVTHARFKRSLDKSKAGSVLVERGFGRTPMPAVLCQDVNLALATVLGVFAPPAARADIGIHPSAIVANSATLGREVAIGPGVIIGEQAQIGDQTVLDAGVFVGAASTVGRECRLWNNVFVGGRCRIGDHVTIHPNAVIGADGFGYYLHQGKHRKVPHIGGVVIGDDVEIGACSCIDRSKMGDTIIGPGTKIDNLVQVAHNVEIGANSLLCAQAGVAGSARLGTYVVLGGQVGVRDNIVLHDRVMVAACSCVPQDVAAGTKVSGVPAIESRRFLRENASMRRLPGLVALIQELARRVEKLEAAADDRPDR